MLVVTNSGENSTRKNKFNLLTNRIRSKLTEEPSPKAQFSANLMIIKKIKFIDHNFDKPQKEEFNYNNFRKQRLSFNKLSRSVEKAKSKNIREIEKNLEILNEESAGAEKDKIAPIIENLPLTMNKKQKLPCIKSLTKLPQTIQIDPTPVKIRIIKNHKEHIKPQNISKSPQNSKSPQKKNKYNYV